MTITEVSEQFNISPDTLRYYERIGLIPPVKRNERGVRDYGEIDLNWIEFIKCMRSVGLSIEVLMEYVQLCMQGDKTVQARKEILQEQRDQLIVKIEEMKKTLDMLNHKIEVYENIVLKKEKELIQNGDYDYHNFGTD
ncbi:MerR family transcriptional regulator [Desulfoscipio geothermicus]|uniref:DNA-binding transcriptional regulator, MerR family n=1 Tax=Desulfoscipio geothermicus DSM 3669 TaxID=1121426 RepID=A0A1I6EFP4_9FIRM|nr:MerR family transcriptional regulator [Desulfoscipio geothermicus]SFR16560.1 DNA-binding transcriptional regulator, MerR family [Desulfoscipio geothermicus DSM 3669]